jgi:hypothetical protein
MPFLLIELFVSNVMVLDFGFYGALFVAQCGFYLLALAGMWTAKRRIRLRYGLMCYFICAMNLAFLIGFFRACRGRGGNVWQRAN